MSDATAILYPAIAMALLTLAMVLYLGFARYTAIQRRDVSIKFYRLYNEGVQPDRLALIGRHVQNHFEAPPLFHVAIVLLFATGQVTGLAVVLAWLYFLLRCLHSSIHLGSNNVTRRFFTYGTSIVVLTGLWLHLLISLLLRD